MLQSLMALAPIRSRDFDPLRLRPWFAARGLADMMIPDVFRKTVAFIGHKVDGDFVPEATAFFVTIMDHGFQFVYLVTADHVIAKMAGTGKTLILRTNKKNGKVQEDILSEEGWIFTEENNKTDVALRPVSISSDEDVFAIALNGTASLKTEDVEIEKMPFGVGDEVAIIGLFRSHYGLNKNVPVVRIGNISAMTEEKISTKEYGYLDAYLVEARSIGGLSGSPVFVNMPTFAAPPRQPGKMNYLLGLMHGHFDIQDLNSDTVTDKYANAYGDINTGMGVVIPCWKIMDLINSDELIESRTQSAAVFNKKNGATADFSDLR